MKTWAGKYSQLIQGRNSMRRVERIVGSRWRTRRSLGHHVPSADSGKFLRVYAAVGLLAANGFGQKISALAEEPPPHLLGVRQVLPGKLVVLRQWFGTYAAPNRVIRRRLASVGARYRLGIGRSRGFKTINHPAKVRCRCDVGATSLYERQVGPWPVQSQRRSAEPYLRMLDPLVDRW